MLNNIFIFFVKVQLFFELWMITDMQINFKQTLKIELQKSTFDINFLIQK